MPAWMILVIGIILGAILASMLLARTRQGKIQAEYEAYILKLQAEHTLELQVAQKRSVNTSRAVLKGKMAEQFAPILPEFNYLPADARFLGDPIDYVIFDGYTAFRDGEGRAEDIKVIFMDIKSGKARLTAGQKAIAQSIDQKKVRFETLYIQFDE
ncbi:Holliday junction resolvase-like protein [Acinetobacter boissieri]|uniref:Predicted secreted endonuclease n=1 Tax=Acinetobacter boissieri TaxID=1219383 RepID=A0A1G6HXV7_9GAMM|nr:Holliday junction resolvase-like protein [Acinetobacter boissieri]SDB99157.1 Predicted secreted endonuclease [Acinetobacter boissieri]